MKFYVIAYGNTEDKRQGIFSIEFNKNNKLINLLDFYPTEDKPAGFIVNNNKMIMSSMNSESKKAYLTVLNIEKNGNLLKEKSYSQDYFYSYLDLSIDKNYLLGASFYEGIDSVFSIGDLTSPISTNIHEFRKRSDKPVQQACHSHFIGMTPDEKHIYSIDIGTDEVFLYNFERGVISLNKENSLDRPLGSGPRLMPFSNNGNFAYLLNELDNKINVFSYEKGGFKEIQNISTLDKDFKGENTAAGIKISKDNKYLAITNRGEDSVVIYSVNSLDGTLELKDRTYTGKKPRDLEFIENDYIAVCSQDDSKIQIIEIGEKVLLLETFVSIPSPVFIR